MKTVVLILVFFLSTVAVWSQECTFDYYQRTGGIYYFSTFYKGHNPNELLDEVCSKTVNGEPYEYRELKNGRLQIERLYLFGTGKTYSEFKRVSKDSIIGEFVHKPDGNTVELKQTYYLNKEGKRCWKEETYRQGKLYQVRYFRNFMNTELVEAGYPSRPAHLIDADGYCDVSAQFGKETCYHPNGKILSVSEHMLIVSDNPNLFPSQNGNYVVYSDKGIEIQRGTYVNGRASGKFTYHHLNGRLSGIRYFENDLPVGDWIEYYDDGSLFSTISYGSAYYWPTGHEKRYFRNGNLQYESIIDSVGKGFRVEYYEDGKCKTRTVFSHGPNERTAYMEWYPDGQLKQKSYLRAQNDTLSAVYYPDGFLKTINLQFADVMRHEMRQYFANHQLEVENIIERVDGKVFQTHNTYTENGTLISSMESKGTERVAREYWKSGGLKSEKQFDNNLLNGYWTEQDSLGSITKKCHYVNGYSDSMCVFPPKLVLKALDEATERLILPMTVSAVIRAFNYQNEIVPANDVKRRAQTLKKAIMYLQSYHSNFELVHGRDSIADFRYLFSIASDVYTKNRSKVDSLFSALKLKNVQPLVTNSQLTSGLLSSESFYTLPALDSIFETVVATGGGLFGIVNRLDDYDLDFYYHNRANRVEFEEKEEEQAWLVTVNGTQVVVYNDGMVELFNGTDVMVAQPIVKGAFK